MHEQNKSRLDVSASGGAKRLWLKPTLSRLEAGEAELGTRRAVSDGGFTTS